MDLTGHLLYYQEGKHKINLDNYVQLEQLKETSDAINNSVTEALKSKVDSITKITWADLKNLRDNSQLIPGSLYRITDYNCTTTQENTRSAGHQFDIVLLALSANKLAEEGWAMMNESNIYDVTFDDGVTKKCWLYLDVNADDTYNIVDVETLLGANELVNNEDFTIDEVSKTITILLGSSNLNVPNLTYNYFQNSNLSAWKVWYCLDNDTARFAWAKDYINPADNQRMLMSKKADSDWSNVIYVRYPQGDCEKGIAWAYYDLDYDGTQTYQSVIDDGGTYVEPSELTFTNNENPKAGDIGELWQLSPSVRKLYDVEITDVSWGTGVIYRLIDEWNNDVAYDFKNIQFIRPMTDGEYDAEGTDTWVYTFSPNGADEIFDVSTIPYANHYSQNNRIGEYLIGSKILGYNVMFNAVGCVINGDYSSWNTIIGAYITMIDSAVNVVSCERTDLVHCSELTIEGGYEGFYLNNKKVLTET